MNRTAEIEDTLQRANAPGATPGSTDWLVCYRQHVAYLLEVLRSYGPPLQIKLREHAYHAERLARSRSRWRFATIVLALACAASVTAAWSARDPVQFGATAAASSVAESSSGTGGASARTLAQYDGPWCTPWEPAGQLCDGGRGCLWVRWCTACIPGCGWYQDFQCRANSGAACPESISPVHGAE